MEGQTATAQLLEDQGGSSDGGIKKLKNGGKPNVANRRTPNVGSQFNGGENGLALVWLLSRGKVHGSLQMKSKKLVAHQ